MSFVFPGFLFALLAVSIPVAIHLFHFRRFRKVFFSNVSFLQQLSDESKKQSRLKHLLVLAARILAIIFFVLAFAKPYIPATDAPISSDGNAVAVYIDNSFSMDVPGEQGRLIEEAKTKASELAGVYQLTDRFMLLTNDFEGRHQRFVSRDEFLSMVEEVEISSALKTTKEVIQRMDALFEEERLESKRSYLISDYQKSVVVFDDLETDTTVVTTLIPLSLSKVNNVFIDSCWFETPVTVSGQSAGLVIRIRNNSDRKLENQAVRLFDDGTQRALATFDIDPEGSTEVVLHWAVNQAGLHQGYIEIIDYPITFDDRLYFSFRVRNEIPVLVINDSGTNPFLNALFGNDSLFDYHNMPVFSIDYSRFSTFDMVVLNGLNSITPGLAFELQTFVQQGGNLVVFPGEQIDLDTYDEFLSAMNLDVYSRLDTTAVRVSELNELHQIYTGVFENIPENMDMPVASQYYIISRSIQSASQPMMQLQNGRAFFISQQSDIGTVFLSAVPLRDHFSNFHRHALFVPTMVNIALQSQSFKPLYHTLGNNQPLLVKGETTFNDDVFTLSNDDFEIIPEQRRLSNHWQLLVHDQIENVGNYTLYSGSKAVEGISFNNDPRESLLETYSLTDLEGVMMDAGLDHFHLLASGGREFEHALQEFRLGRQLWRLCIMLALLFILAEVALLRFWK